MLRQFPAIAAALLLGSLFSPSVRAASEPAKASPPPRNFAAEIAQARAAWMQTSGELYDVLSRLAPAVEATRELTKKLDAKRREIADLEKKRDRALEEMQHGEFCTGCGRTRSDILAHGERFPHAGQQVRPATPEELENARRAFESQLASLRAELSKLERQKPDADGLVNDLYLRHLRLYPLYQHQLVDERNLRAAEWLAQSGALTDRLRQLNRNAVEAENAFAGAPASDRAAEKIRVEQTHRLAQEAVADARAATARAEGQRRDFTLAVNSDIDRLGRVATVIPGGFGTPDGWFIEKVIRSCPPLDYTIGGIPGAETIAARTHDARELLEGPDAADRGKSTRSSSSSARDLLEGH